VISSRTAVTGEAFRDQCINEHADMLSRVLGHVFGVVAKLLKEVIYGVPPVKERPQMNAGGVQAKTAETIAGIGVEKNGPVVELLPEDDVWVG
jgi:hypothetical protein